MARRQETSGGIFTGLEIDGGCQLNLSQVAGWNTHICDLWVVSLEAHLGFFTAWQLGSKTGFPREPEKCVTFL